jgi:ABC-type nitrate/sulfonate/bicarbonate transport system substrate-binding protein
MKNKKLIVITLLAGVFLSVCLSSCDKKQQPSQQATAHLEVVRFANLPYADHTITSIGVEKGWFREAGIDLQVTTIKVEEVVPGLVKAKYDAASVPPGILFSSHDTAPGLVSFVFSDLFQGFALMGQPDAGLKTYAEFIKEGKSHEEALVACVGQLRGKTFAYPTETAVKPFIDQLLVAGHLAESDFKPLVLDDTLTVSSMRKKEADFQVGGVPSRIVLEKEGFIPIVSSVDLARGAAPSADSPELASILQNGWACTKSYYDQNRGTVLKLASVNYRTMRFIKDHEDEALSIHMKYLSNVTGQEFTLADGKVIYHNLDPFFTFEDQRSWFLDPKSPLYYEYVNGAILRTFTSKNVFKNKPPVVDDVIYADDTYREMVTLRDKASELLDNLSKKSMNTELQRITSRAKDRIDAYDFAEGVRLLEQQISPP